MNRAMVKNGAGSANSKAATNIWQVMNYPVPRGKCVHKVSMLSPACPCLRFMLNPLQAASSFACDGCGHHASFHNLRNPGEDDDAPVEEQMLLTNGTRNITNGSGRKRSATVAGNTGSAQGRITRGRDRADDEEEEVVELDEGDMQVVKRSRGS